jgi:hypothetical protein
MGWLGDPEPKDPYRYKKLNYSIATANIFTPSRISSGE